MPKHPARAALESALRESVIPDLRERGFRGSFPHFRRLLPTRIDLLTFQFYSSGGSFVVEIAQCGADGAKLSWKTVAPEKSTAIDVLPRLRLGSDPANRRHDHWFVFGKRNYEAGHEHVEPPAHYQQIASRVKELVGTQGETYWQRNV